MLSGHGNHLPETNELRGAIGWKGWEHMRVFFYEDEYEGTAREILAQMRWDGFTMYTDPNPDVFDPDHYLDWLCDVVYRTVGKRFDFTNKTLEEKVKIYFDHWEKVGALIYLEDSIMKNQYVWYVTYGSSMRKEQLLAYINGGLFRANGKTYRGCTDKSPPLRDKPFLLPFDLYFGNESKSWNGSGVAFIDADTPGVTLGRAYLITEEQFFEIQKQAGASDKWYGKVVELSFGVNDIPYKTFTSKIRRPENKPSKNYLNTFFEGLCETYPQLYAHEI